MKLEVAIGSRKFQAAFEVLCFSDLSLARSPSLSAGCWSLQRGSLSLGSAYRTPYHGIKGPWYEELKTPHQPDQPKHLLPRCRFQDTLSRALTDVV